MCWVHHIEPETKDNRYSRSSLTYPLRSRLLSRDVDGISFLGSNGIMFIDYLKKAELLRGNIMLICCLKQMRKQLRLNDPAEQIEKKTGVVASGQCACP